MDKANSGLGTTIIQMLARQFDACEELCQRPNELSTIAVLPRRHYGDAQDQMLNCDLRSDPDNIRRKQISVAPD